MKPKIQGIADQLNALSYSSIFLLWAANILVFAALYVACSLMRGSSPTDLDSMATIPRILNAIYYSVITATNTGYGDIVPQGISKLFAALEAFSGLFLFALFMSKLVSQRQDIAITQMHKISFEGTFHDIREDLHIVRRDFDMLMQSVRDNHQLTASEWKQFIIACQQIENLITEVPNFYDKETNLYRIDLRREGLLVEAFHRTLERLKSLLRLFNENGIEWLTHVEVVEQLQQVLLEVGTIIRGWQTDSEGERQVLFQLLEKQTVEIRELMNSNILQQI